MQIFQIPHVIFESTSQFFFKIFSAKHNSSVPFLAQRANFIYFRVLKSKFVKFLNSSPNFESLFIVMTHNCSANFKLIHFLLWTKESHQSPNFDTFKCSGENLLNSSCHFSNHKSVFLQILHHSTVP